MYGAQKIRSETLISFLGNYFECRESIVRNNAISFAGFVMSVIAETDVSQFTSNGKALSDRVRNEIKSAYESVKSKNTSSQYIAPFHTVLQRIISSSPMGVSRSSSSGRNTINSFSSFSSRSDSFGYGRESGFGNQEVDIDSKLEGLKSSLSSGSWTARNRALEDVHGTLNNIIREKRRVEASDTVQSFVKDVGNLLNDSNRSSVQECLRIVGKFGRVCGESLSELTDKIVPKLFNSLADNETKTAGKEALEAWTEAVSVVRGMKILPEVVSFQSLIVRKEALL